MRRTFPVLLTLWACKADSPTRVFCGEQALDRVRSIDGDLVDQTLAESTCWARTQGVEGGPVTLQRFVPGGGAPDGACRFESPDDDGPFEGDCYWWAGPVQLQAHLIPGEGTVTATEESLDLDLRVWTTDWNGSRLYYGRGEMLFSGAPEAVPAVDPLAEPRALPVCYPEDCYEGQLALVGYEGPPACQEAIDAVAGTRHRVTLLDDSQVLADGVTRQAAVDLDVCATHYADDADPFDTKTYTLGEDSIYVEQYSQWTHPQTGLPVRCEIRWSIATGACI